MRGRLLVLISVLFLQAIAATAQKESHIWYFGKYAGLDFGSGSPVALGDGVMHQWEGSATIADRNGNLLFYTDGVNIWNRQHKMMPNNTPMKGDYSSTQSALIVPKPQDPYLYYVFTTPSDGSDGLYYSVVDIRADGGLGDLVSVNTPLVSPVSEKLTAVAHANGRDVWVLVHGWGNNAFYAYLVTPSGVSASPVTSFSGLVHSSFGAYVGCMKVSPDARKLAVAISNTRTLELFDFDALSGVVSNPLTVKGFTPDVYGLGFAPSAPLLYATTWGSGDIYQLNLSGSAADILASLKVVAVSASGCGDLQTGPDGHMYVARTGSDYLGIIREPDSEGALCDYVDDGIYLGNESTWGLPNFIQSYFLPGTFSFSGTCAGSSTAFSCIADVDSARWDFGDGSPVSSLLNPVHLYSAAGTYTVRLTWYKSGQVRVSTQPVVIRALPQASIEGNLRVCSGWSTTLKATGGLHYRWSTGDTSASITVKPGVQQTISVIVNDGACSGTASAVLTVVKSPERPVASALYVCPGDTFPLQAACSGGGTIDWYADSRAEHLLAKGSPAFRPQIDEPGTYTFYCGQYAGGCTSELLPVEYIVKPRPKIALPELKEITTNQEAFLLEASPEGGIFSGTGVSGKFFDPEAAGPGEHKVSYTVESEGCTSTAVRTINVKRCCSFSNSFLRYEIYPNPSADGVFRICPDSELAYALKMMLTAFNVYNASGGKVYSEYNEGKIVGENLIDLSGLAKGMYFVEIVTYDKVFTRKVMIQ